LLASGKKTLIFALSVMESWRVLGKGEEESDLLFAVFYGYLGEEGILGPEWIQEPSGRLMSLQTGPAQGSGSKK
jgi:hypothetical protein